MKKIFLITIISLTATLSKAQFFDYGLKGGVVFNTDKGEVWKDAGNIFKKNGKASSGFQVGGLMKLYLANIYVQPEVLYTQFKNDYDYESNDFSLTKKRIDFSINVGKQFLGIAHVQAGPVFSNYLKNRITLNDINNVKQDNFNVGMQIGAGIQFSRLLFDLRYEFGFGKMTSRFWKNNTEFKVENRPQLLNLTIGYLLWR